MVRFAHIADCHLGSWRQQELQDLNFSSFQKAIEIILDEKIDFVLISGDLFDSAYPPIEILKKTFGEFRKLKELNVPVYLIAGSHDYSASGKTFLDVLEKAGLCINVEKFKINETEKTELEPTLFNEKIAIYGFSGKKSSMEVDELKKVFIKGIYQNTILMLHTTINEVSSNELINSIDKNELPLADYYAMGHIHQRFCHQEKNSYYVYPGPTFPNNFQELADLKSGSFQITEIRDKIRTINIKIPTKDIVYLELEIKNSFTATEEIIEKIDKLNLKDKIFLLKLKGVLETGKSGDIKFNEIEEFVKKKNAFSYLRNISQLKTKESEFTIHSANIDNVEEMEKSLLNKFSLENPNDFNKFLPELMNILSLEKNEDEKSIIFEKRLLDDLKKIINLGEDI